MTTEHQSEGVRKLFKALEKQGFEVSAKSKRGKFRITPPAEVKGPVYFTHGTESCIHQVKRDVKKLYDIDV